MNKSKVAIVVNKTVSIIQMIVAIAIFAFFGLYTLIYIFDADTRASGGIEVLVFCLIFDALGVWLFTLSRKKSKLIKEFKKYVSAVSNDPDGYIPDIAASLGTSEDVVRKNLELMIKKKFFVNAFIDKDSNCIKILNRQNTAAVQQQRANIPYNTPIQATPTEMVTVKCSGCGGINTLRKGEVGECDYCGSAIKAE